MAVRTKDEIMTTIRSRLGDDTTDETLAFIEDISDTYDELEKQVKDSGEWKTKYEENDKEWRDKYKERFFSASEDQKDEQEEEQEEEKSKPLRYEDLFTSEEK